MTVDATWLLPYGAASLGLVATWCVAVALCAHHLRRSRVARLEADAAEGVALVGGVVERVEDGPDEAEAVLWLFVRAAGAAGDAAETIGAHPFSLRLPSGVSVRIEPAHGAWSLDTTFVSSRGPPGLARPDPAPRRRRLSSASTWHRRFVSSRGPPGLARPDPAPRRRRLSSASTWHRRFVPVPSDQGRLYQATVFVGDELFVRGPLERGHDPRAAGTGYRDAARAWVMRGALAFSAASVIAAHASRARFHGRWAAALSMVAVGLGGWLTFANRTAQRLDASPLIALGVVCLCLGYGFASEATIPWLHRKVRVRGAWLG